MLLHLAPSYHWTQVPSALWSTDYQSTPVSREGPWSTSFHRSEMELWGCCEAEQWKPTGMNLGPWISGSLSSAWLEQTPCYQHDCVSSPQKAQGEQYKPVESNLFPICLGYSLLLRELYLDIVRKIKAWMQKHWKSPDFHIFFMWFLTCLSLKLRLCIIVQPGNLLRCFGGVHLNYSTTWHAQ